MQTVMINMAIFKSLGCAAYITISTEINLIIKDVHFKFNSKVLNLVMQKVSKLSVALNTTIMILKLLFSLRKRKHSFLDLKAEEDPH